MQEGLNGFPHWMLKEIFEQPDALDRTLAADGALTTQAGVEKAIPATKSFTTQLLLLAVLAEQAAAQRGLPAIGLEKVVPQIITQMRAWLPRWQQVVAVAAGRLQAAETFLF